MDESMPSTCKAFINLQHLPLRNIVLTQFYRFLFELLPKAYNLVP